MPDASRLPPWSRTPPTAAHRASFADAVCTPYWLDALPPREPAPPLEGALETELCIVGGGFTGLWAALHARNDDPGRDVMLLEGETIGFGASGRNGGFLSSSLTHGIENGLSRFPDELETLERLGRENYDGLQADLVRHGIDCDLEQTGALHLATEPYQVAELAEAAEVARRFGHEADVLDGDAARSEIHSPLYLGGLWVRGGRALVDPGKLADGLGRAAVSTGVRVHERTPVHSLRSRGGRIELGTPAGTVTARSVLLGTNAYAPLLRQLRRYVVAVYDYVLVTEPLSAEQKHAIGWERRQGLSDGGNQFHYYRLTADDRILYGGYDAVYRYGSPVEPRLDDHDPTFTRLAQHFFTTFPQLEGIRFSHRWGGAIDTCSRFSVFFGTAHRGRVAYAAGYTGLGVGSTRFGARVALDLLDGRDTEATRLRYVRRKPVPFPPEPLRSAVIQLTRNRLAAADRSEGRRGLWLRTLDRLGLGFDS
jgi:glycine/D-amino acid oxidase-like deaminating enzyme